MNRPCDAGSVTFARMDKREAASLLPALFSLLRENMDPIAPTGRSYAEDYALWSAEVGPALQKENRHLVLIRDDGALIGFLQYYVNPTTFMIEEAQLKPAYQNAGVMRALFVRLADRIPRDVRYAEAFTDRRNEKPQRILTRLGFEKIGETEDGAFFRYRRDCRSFLDRFRTDEARAACGNRN